MRWPWRPPPSRGEIIAVVVCAVIGVIFLFALTKFPQLGWGWVGHSGFGTDWDCVPTPQSEQVCIKRVPASPPNKATPSN
jgi:hypothetical protein